MTQIYEGMFLLNNQMVREDWNAAKANVTDMLAKHGATVLSARRWDERKLAYPIEGSLRATYLLTFFNIPGDNLPAMTRDFNLNEEVLRYIQLSVDKIPDGELELADAENADDFTIPAPPPDDAPEIEEEAKEPEEDEDADVEVPPEASVVADSPAPAAERPAPAADATEPATTADSTEEKEG
ncbi:MAG: small subunit ribosomal protein S6 [Planctomycetota bacterium]|jgi:small subunit ribosomal protein S6